MLSPNEQAVINYLKTAPDSFFSLCEICRKAGTKAQWEENRHWALRILSRLVELGLVEQDEAGHYRIVTRRPA